MAACALFPFRLRRVPLTQHRLGVIAKDMVRKPLPGCWIHESVLSADYHSWPADIHEAVRSFFPQITHSLIVE